jgi:hypothetical protein
MDTRMRRGQRMKWIEAKEGFPPSEIIVRLLSDLDELVEIGKISNGPSAPSSL